MSNDLLAIIILGAPVLSWLATISYVALLLRVAGFFTGLLKTIFLLLLFIVYTTLILIPLLTVTASQKEFLTTPISNSWWILAAILLWFVFYNAFGFIYLTRRMESLKKVGYFK